MPPARDDVNATGGARLSLVAIGLGLAIDQLTLALVESVLRGALVLRGFDPASVPAESAVPTGSPAALLAFVGLGAACGVFGGYAAARVAGRRELVHAAAVGAGDLAVGFYRITTSALILPPWYVVLSFALAVPAAMLGGLLARRSSGAFR